MNLNLNLNPKNIIKKLLYILLITMAVPFLFGFLNFLHPLFDSFSHFRVHLLLMILPTMLLLAFFHEVKNMLIFFLFILLGIFYLYYINQPFKAQPITKNRTHKLKHIQFNLLFNNKKIDKVISYLQESSADVITLEEVTKAHQEALSSMRYEDYSLEFNSKFPYVARKQGAYPYQIYCPFQSVGSVAILSKHPFNEEQSVCLKYQGLLWQQILLDKKPINIVAIHTYWPYPYTQPEQIEKIKPIFKHIKGSTLIAGDFNAVAWSHTLKEIEKASHTKVVEGLRWTIELKKQLPLIPHFKLPIDHLLLSKEFQVKSIFVDKELGSDHRPVVSEIWY